MRLIRVFLESVNKLYGMLVIINVSVDLKSELAAHVNTVSVDEVEEMWNSEILLSWNSNFVGRFKWSDYLDELNHCLDELDHGLWLWLPTMRPTVQQSAKKTLTLKL